LGGLCWYDGTNSGSFRFCDSNNGDPAPPTPNPDPEPEPELCIISSIRSRRKLTDFLGRLLPEVDPCTAPDCPAVDLKVQTKLVKKGGEIKILVKVANNGRTSVQDGVLALTLPEGVRFLDITSWPKNQGRVHVVDGGMLISGISLPRKKDAVMFKLTLGVQSNAGNSLVFTVYFHDYDQKCTDTKHVLRLK